MRLHTPLSSIRGLYTLKLPPLARWIEVMRQRRALARLSDAQLEDLGLTREDALEEAARPFWDLPGH